MFTETEPHSSFGPEDYVESFDLNQASDELAQLSPRERIEWASNRFLGRLVVPTTFGPTAPVMLREVTDVIPDIPVVSIRHGYETERTLELADWYKEELDLNLNIYQAPKLPIPLDDTPEFEEFQQKVKVDPFQTMLDDFQPGAYFSGVMRWQTPQRESLPFIQDKGSVLAINPVLDMTEHEVDKFFEQTGLPRNDDYFDPTKGPGQSSECKLNTSTYK